MAEKRKWLAKKGKGPRVKQRREPKWKETIKEIEEVCGGYETLDPAKVSSFSDLPLSNATKQGLRACGYTQPTDIQREAIPLALRKKDVLGAAKTGSGKTLAFLVPLLELLWRERWSTMDGLGALVISPTRELAYQTFEVLKKVGCRHDFSAGLVTGGKDIATEKNRIQATNIVICTPGRLLQHMDETANFECSSLKMLILDEADRILDLGFQHALNAIIENIPMQRQTLLFSATQTRSVHDLARLSLVEPEYVAVHEHSKCSTPHRLTQSYILCSLQDKLSVLFSFIRSHVTNKIIVFMSSCKQVKFVYESFRRLRPGVPLLALYGRQKHLKRMAIYEDFCRKKASVLFCTDIAARGLDIPAVNWVIQLDCPEDANTYIHRVGRTARYEKDGKGLLFLLPSEKAGMLTELSAKKIPIEEIRVNPRKTVSIRKKLESLCTQNTDLKQWAQRSFICYLRSVHLQSNKTIFDVHKLPVETYAASLGLPKAPRVRFLQKLSGKGKGEEEEERGEGEEGEEGEESGEGGEEGVYSDESGDESVGGSEVEEPVLFVKRVIPVGEVGSTGGVEQPGHKTGSGGHDPDKQKSKVSSIKKILNKKIKLNSHVKFDDQGEMLEGEGSASERNATDSDDSLTSMLTSGSASREEVGRNAGGIRMDEAQEVLKAQDRIDRDFERERVRQVHRGRRLKGKRQGLGDGPRGGVGEDGGSAELGDGQVGRKRKREEVIVVQDKRRRKSGEGKMRDRGAESQDGEGVESGVTLSRGRGTKSGSGTDYEMGLFEDEELAKHLLGL